MAENRQTFTFIARHRTSISLEAPFWDELKRIAEARRQSVPGLLAAIDAERGSASLSSGISAGSRAPAARPACVGRLSVALLAAAGAADYSQLS
jgi:Ribbon-helix-helix domain